MARVGFVPAGVLDQKRLTDERLSHKAIPGIDRVTRQRSALTARKMLVAGHPSPASLARSAACARSATCSLLKMLET